MEVLREKELKELIDIISNKPYGKYLITGPAGSGKSFLLSMIALTLEQKGQAIIYEMLRYEGNNAERLENISNIIYLHDGLDESFRKKKVLEEIKKSRNCCICTARENTFDIVFDYELKLKPLNVEQVFLLVNEYCCNRNGLDEFINHIFKNIDDRNMTPRSILEILHLWMKDYGYNEDFFLMENSHQLYTYGEGVSLQHSQMIVPERKIIRVPTEIKSDINIVKTSLLKQVAHKPELIYDITPREFEELVCELFDKRGYNVKLTKQTRDGGKDLIVLNNSILGDMVIYAECKRFSKNHPVNIGLVKQLYGTVEADRATAGIMITTSYFSKDARKFQESIKSRMSLMDYTELMKNIVKFR